MRILNGDEPIRSLAKGNVMILGSKRAIVAALATMAIMFTGSLLAAGSASAAPGAKASAASSTVRIVPRPIVIFDR